MICICSALSGKVALKHPELNVLVRGDGAILRTKRSGVGYWSFGCDNGKGYMRVNIQNKCYKVHRLVAEVFIPNPNGKPTVDHINRVRGDNRFENLRWATMAEQADNSSLGDNPRYGFRSRDNLKLYKHLYNIDIKNDPESHRKRIEAVNRCVKRHRDNGEIHHKCPYGKHRWHKPGMCPIANKFNSLLPKIFEGIGRNRVQYFWYSMR